MRMTLVKKCLFFVVVVGVFFSCNRKATQLNKAVEENKLDYSYFTTKAKIHYMEDSSSIQANLYLKMEHEKMVWASVSKLGKEAMRVKLTPDTTSFMNKYPADERCYSIFSTKDYLKKLGVEGELKDLQNVFLGNQPLKVKRKDQVKHKGEETVLTQIRDSITVVSKLNTISSKLMESKIYSGSDTVSVFYSNYKNIENKLVPHKIIFKLNVLKEEKRTNSTVELIYLKPKFISEAPSFTFKIPSSYEKCK